MLKRICCALLLSLCLCTGAYAGQLSTEDRQEALRLIEALGGKDMILQYVRQNIGLVKKFRPDIPAGSMPAVERELSAFIAEKLSAPGGLLEQVAAVYAKHFTPEEVRQLLAFYESPVGRKAVATLPQIMKESRDVAQRMGIGLIPELNRRITEALQREAAASQPNPQANPQ